MKNVIMTRKGVTVSRKPEHVEKLKKEGWAVVDSTKEKAEKEAKEKAEKEAKEKAEKEAKKAKK